MVTSSQWPSATGATSRYSGSRALPLLPGSAHAKDGCRALCISFSMVLNSREKPSMNTFLCFLQGVSLNTLIRRIDITSRALGTEESAKCHFESFQTAWEKGIDVNKTTYTFTTWTYLIDVSRLRFIKQHLFSLLLPPFKLKNIFLFVRYFNTSSAESVRNCTLFSAWALLGRPSGPDAACFHPLWTAVPLIGSSRLVTSLGS